LIATRYFLVFDSESSGGCLPAAFFSQNAVIKRNDSIQHPAYVANNFFHPSSVQFLVFVVSRNLKADYQKRVEYPSLNHLCSFQLFFFLGYFSTKFERKITVL
jgi:hypothetical protein